MLVGSLASLSRLRIRWYSKLWHRLRMWLRSSVAVAVACRLAAAALILPPAQGLPYAAGSTVKRKKKKFPSLLLKTVFFWFTMVSPFRQYSFVQSFVLFLSPPMMASGGVVSTLALEGRAGDLGSASGGSWCCSGPQWTLWWGVLYLCWWHLPLMSSFGKIVT